LPLDIVRNYGRKPIYLKLGATYCIPCRPQMPEFERFCEANGDRMQIVAVNAGVGDDPAKVRACVAAAKLRMPVAIDDGTLGSWLQMEATPFRVLIGLDGRIAHVGYRDGAWPRRSHSARADKRAKERSHRNGTSAADCRAQARRCRSGARPARRR
jgi:hypothetical protein